MTYLRKQWFAAGAHCCLACSENLFWSLFFKVFQKCTMDLSCKTLIEVLVLNFEAMFAAVGKVRKKDFCIAFSGKQQKCCELAPLKP